MDLQSVLDEVGAWPVDQRLRLIERVWETISGAPEGFSLTEAQKHDLRRRLDAYRDNPTAGSPWEEVEARLREDKR
jgi:putative addiction module component (TIGR02574 family)